jgi:uncharacterized phage infection (PIP) family protein YhgE
MPSLDDVEQEVSALNENESTPFEFRDAFTNIEEAAKAAPDVQVARLRAIVSTFRGKLPRLIILNGIRAGARDLADTLMLATLQERIRRINARNEALADLTSELQTQINKANGDANLLKSIKDGVEKATKTLNEAKAIVDQLSDTDNDTKEKLKLLLEGLGRISSILQPQQA